MKLPVLLILALLIFSSCVDNQADVSTPVLDKGQYEQYLSNDDRSGLMKAEEQFAFWNPRIAEDSSGVGDLGPTAAAYQALFAQTGDVTVLAKAEKLYLKAFDISAHNKDGFARSLAGLYITQHKFKKAEAIMKRLEGLPTKKIDTDYVMFDILMELGEYEKAGDHLFAQIDKNKFDYLVRRAKWEDYQGNLDQAIQHLEWARDIAESSNNKGSKIWTYTNIADFYGHDGQIEKSRDHFLKALALEPDNHYAKKGLAWIAYSNDNNPAEANRILDSLLIVHDIPDYYLLKAEIAESEGQTDRANKLYDQFIAKAENPNYGGMYNTYLIEIYADRDPAKALAIATQELENRDTPETRQLLALAQLKNGQLEAAKETIETYVIDKTHEPTAALTIGEVYDALGEKELAETYYSSIADARYELGPVTYDAIPFKKG
jgi:tetratricopeptide (TPR) repeat protein